MSDRQPPASLRPWTPEAAMEPVPPIGPPRAVRVRGPRQRPRFAARRQDWAMPLLVAVAIVAAIAVSLIARHDFVSTRGPTDARTLGPPTVGALRATSAQSAGSAASAPTQTSFPSTTKQIVIDATVSGQSSGDTLEWRVELETGPGQPAPSTLSDTVEPIPAGGHVEHVVTGQPGGFVPGRYRVTVMHGLITAGSVEFTVTPAAP